MSSRVVRAVCRPIRIAPLEFHAMIRTHPSRLKMPVDNLLFGAMLALIVFGLWMVFDSSYVKTLDDARTHYDAFYFLRKQAVGAFIGIGALFAAMRFGYWTLRRVAVPLMGASLLLLIAVWLPHIGVTENNAHRWLNLGGPLKFQPSEVAKLALIAYLAALFSRPTCKIRDFADGLAPPLLVVGLTCLLIEREPDLGTAAVVFVTAMTVFFVAGARKRHIALITGVTALAVGLLGFGFGHRNGRIDVYLHPEKYKTGIGYQVYHSKLAVGSGGWMGAGLGRGREKYYLPQGDTDFIFSTVAEELGFLRTLPLLLGLMLVAWRGFRIASQCKDRFGSLLASGITALICWQALVNIAVATASIPATGVPLPFISFGSSSLILFMVGIGLLLNIAQHPTPPAQEKRKA